MKKRSNPEREFAIKCVSWFDQNYPQYSQLFFHINNESAYNKYKGRMNQSEGIRSGVADYFLSVPKIIETDKNEIIDYDSFAGLYIELKSNTGKQAPNQKKFQEAVTKQGYAYVLVKPHHEDELHIFKTVVRNYLQEPTLTEQIENNNNTCTWDELINGFDQLK